MVQTTLEDVSNAGPEEIAVFFFFAFNTAQSKILNILKI